MFTSTIAAQSTAGATACLRDLRDLATEDLLHEHELLQWDRLRMLASDASADSIELADITLRAMEAEIALRQRLLARYKHDPLRPRWPDTSTRWYHELQQVARDLKQVWPIAHFVSAVMGVELRPTGRSMVGRCPLPDHDDRNPSFHVYPADDRWHCYGCNRDGDIFDLTGWYFGLLSFRERVVRVKEAAGQLLGGAA
jgi:hypothetical protein